MDFRSTLQGIVNLSTEDKLKLAITSYTELLPELKKLDSKNNGIALVLAIIGSTVGADGKISSQEAAFILALFKAHGVELTTEDVKKLVINHSGDNWRDLVTKVCSVMPSDKQARLIAFVAAICAIDDRISKEEVSFLADLFSA